MLQIKHLLNLGITDSLDLVESNKQKVFNLFIFLALPSIPLILILNLVNGNYEMVIMNGLQMLVILFAIWISIKRRLLFLRTFLLLLLSTIIFISATLFKPGVEYRLLFLIVVGVILFDNNIKYLLFSILIAFEFTFCKYLELKAITSSNKLLVMGTLQVFLPFLITCVSLYYLKYSYLKSQEKLQKALTEVSLANEMYEKLMYSLAHDLRSPLSNVTSLVNLLKRHQGFSSDELKWLEMIELSTTNSNVLVNDLLEANELMKNAVVLQPNDLNVILENVIHTARLKASTKDISIEFQKWEPTCFSNVDPVKIDRLISNLMNNAIKFSYPSSSIQVSITKLEEASYISIKDQGIGIPQKYLPSIFDPFTKAKRKGTNNEVSYGLGLSICKQITELHGGTIKVISELDKGTEFIVTLPISI
jgi:signal transduction histidine kinase